MNASSPAASVSRLTSTAPTPSRARLWTGRVLSGLLVLFFLFDAIVKVMLVPEVVEKSVELGFSVAAIQAIGVVLLICTVAYVIPRTAVVGAVLLTGYLGGAICTHVHVYEGLFPIVFATVFAILVWLGLGLRDARVGALFAPPS